jgi:hypothetical protein
MAGYKARAYKKLMAYANDWNVLTCEGIDCPKKWAARRHDMGEVDSFGVIHWSKLNSKANVRSLHRLLFLVAQALDRSLRFEPEWLKIYHSARWADKEIERTYHRQPHWEWTKKQRDQVAKLAKKEGVFLRRDYHNVYFWTYYERKLPYFAERRLALRRRRDSQAGTDAGYVLEDTH